MQGPENRDGMRREGDKTPDSREYNHVHIRTHDEAEKAFGVFLDPYLYSPTPKLHVSE